MSSVLIIGPAHPLRGGIANFNETLCKHFKLQGHQCKIISYTLQYPKFLFPGKTQYSSSKKPEDIEIESCINSLNPITWLRTAQKIKRLSPDYIVIAYWMPFFAPALGIIAKIVRKNKTTKVFLLAHNIIPHEKRPGDTILTKYIVKKCDGFITLAQSVLFDIQKFTKNTNKKFIPHPIYDIFGEKIPKKEAISYLKLNEQYQYILFFGLIRNYKGLDLLIKALNNNKLKNKPIKLIVAGEFYEDKTQYTELISQYDLKEKILIYDEFIKNEEVKYFFSAADIIVQPYKTATQSGVSQIAYQFEKPILVTNVGGLAEIVPHEKVGYVTDVNVDAIADALCDFYDNKREKDFSNQSAIEKKRFTWQAMIEAFETLNR